MSSMKCISIYLGLGIYENDLVRSKLEDLIMNFAITGRLEQKYTHG